MSWSFITNQMKISSEDLSKGRITDKMKDKKCEQEKRTKSSAWGCKDLKGGIFW